MVDDRSPLYTRYGEPLADRLVARSLSGMLLAPEHHPGNPSFLSVVRGLSEADKPFAALAVDTAGIDTTGGTSEVVNGTTDVARQPRDSGSVSSDVAAERTEEFAGNLLTHSKATTVDEMPNKSDPGVYVNFIVPISTRTQDFVTYRGLISKWLADQELYLYGVVEGSGITIPDSTTTYDRYAQVGVLYPYAPQGVRELPRSASSDR
jgi:hypothetical protein